MAMEFLKDYIANAFPEEAARYAKVLDEGDKGKQLVMGLAQALRVAITDHDGSIKPEFAGEAQQLQQLEQQVGEYLNPGQGTSQNTNEQPTAPSAEPA